MSNKPLDPAVMEAWLKELLPRLQEFKVDKEQSVKFLNDAVNHFNTMNGEAFRNAEEVDDDDFAEEIASDIDKNS